MINDEYQTALRGMKWETFKKVEFHMSNGERITLRQKTYKNSAGERATAVLTLHQDGDFIAYDVDTIKGWCSIPITEIVSFEPTFADQVED